MKKTLISIAVASMLTSGAVLACSGAACDVSSISSATSAAMAVSGAINNSGGGHSYMSTGAEAHNSASASAYTNPHGIGANTGASTSGWTGSHSYGSTWGDAFGAAGSTAYQAGSAEASALDVGSIGLKPALASAGSEANVSSLSMTGVVGNGGASAHTYTRASNGSSASVSGCGLCNLSTNAATNSYAKSYTPYGDNGSWGNAFNISGGTANADGYGLAIGGLKIKSVGLD